MTDTSDHEIQPFVHTKFESKTSTHDVTSLDQANIANFQKKYETSNSKIKPNTQNKPIVKHNKMEAPVLLSKWLESAEKFRPRESYIWSTTNMTWQNSVSRQLPKTKPYQSHDGLLLGRHREELDAAEALTFLSYSPTLNYQRQLPAISGH